MSEEKKITDTKNLLPLSSLCEGEEGIVYSILGGRGITSRLAAMGIAPGIKVRVLTNSGGPLVVLANGTRVAIGKGQARKITIIKTHATQD